MIYIYIYWDKLIGWQATFLFSRRRCLTVLCLFYLLCMYKEYQKYSRCSQFLRSTNKTWAPEDGSFILVPDDCPPKMDKSSLLRTTPSSLRSIQYLRCLPPAWRAVLARRMSGSTGLVYLESIPTRPSLTAASDRNWIRGAPNALPMWNHIMPRGQIWWRVSGRNRRRRQNICLKGDVS